MSYLIDTFKYSEMPTTTSDRLLRDLRCAWLLVAHKSGLLAQATLAPLTQGGWSAELTASLQASASREVPSVINGGQFIAERMKQVAEDSVKRYPGDLVEIGCHIGETSRMLAEIAQRHGRRLIAIDPWYTSTQAPDGGAFARFQDNIKPFVDVVDVVRQSSLDEAVKKRVSQRALAFAYVDGLHTYYAALSDICMVAHCRGIIAVDDVSYGISIMLAMRRAAHVLGRTAVYATPCKEGYLTPPTT